MPAMANALATARHDRIRRSRQTLVPEFDRLFKTLTAEQKEFWEAMAPAEGAAPRRRLPRNIWTRRNGLLDMLDKLSGTLAADVNHQDATIDQLLAIKQIAWLLRNTAGEASLVDFDRTCQRTRSSPEAKLTYTKFVGGTEIAWNALELTASGMQLPPALASAIAATKTAYFEPQYLQLRDRLLTALVDRRKARTDARTSGARSRSVASAPRSTSPKRALDAAKAHALSAIWLGPHSLTLQLALLAAALALTFGAMIAGHPPRHQAAAQYARRHAQGRRRRSRRRHRLYRAQGRDRRAGRRAGNLQAAGHRQGPDRGAGARAQCRRDGAPAGDRKLCRRVRERGAPDAGPAWRCLRPDAHDLDRPVDGFAPDQRARRRSPKRPPARPR